MDISTLRAAAETIVAAASGFRELPFQFEIKQNDLRHLDGGFSVVWGSGTQVRGQTHQSIQIDQEMRVSLTKRAFIRNDDSKITDAGDALYTAMGTIIHRFVRDKLDLPGTVFQVELNSLEPVERVGEGRDVLALSAVFQVRYLLA